MVDAGEATVHMVAIRLAIIALSSLVSFVLVPLPENCVIAALSVSAGENFVVSSVLGSLSDSVGWSCGQSCTPSWGAGRSSYWIGSAVLFLLVRLAILVLCLLPGL
jgi:hypothetical protein